MFREVTLVGEFVHEAQHSFVVARVSMGFDVGEGLDNDDCAFVAGTEQCEERVTVWFAVVRGVDVFLEESDSGVTRHFGNASFGIESLDAGHWEGVFNHLPSLFAMWQTDLSLLFAIWQRDKCGQEQALTDMAKRKEISDEDVLDAVKKLEPGGTKDIADELGLTRQGAEYRLKKLRKEGLVTSKDIGNSLGWMLNTDD